MAHEPAVTAHCCGEGLVKWRQLGQRRQGGPAELGLGCASHAAGEQVQACPSVRTRTWQQPWQASHTLRALLVVNTDGSLGTETAERVARQHAHHCLLWKSSMMMRGIAGHQQSTGWWRAIFAGSRRARQAVTPTLDTSILSCTCGAQANKNSTHTRCCWWVLTGLG